MVHQVSIIILAFRDKNIYTNRKEEIVTSNIAIYRFSMKEDKETCEHVNKNFFQIFKFIALSRKIIKIR